jgi:hypothetical protein
MGGTRPAPDLVLVACRSEFVTADAAGGIGVLPLDGPSIGGVGIDIAADFLEAENQTPETGQKGREVLLRALSADVSSVRVDAVHLSPLYAT